MMELYQKGLFCVGRVIDHWSPEWFFLILSGIVSLCFVFLLPPFFAPDERTHFMKVVDMSYGHIRAVKVSSYQVGAYLPEKYQLTANRYDSYISQPSVKPPLHIVKEDLTHPLTGSTPIFTPFENTAVYPPLAYVPQTIAVFIARIAGASVLIQLYMARIASMIFWLIIVFFAIRMLPFGKWAAVALSTIPVAYLLAGSESNDAITFGLCLLFVATVIRIFTMPKLENQRLLWFCLLLALGLGLCKQPYSLLTLIVFIIPMRFFSSRRKYLLYCIGCIVGSLFISGLWTIFVRKTYIPTDPSANTSLQLHYILSNPIRAFWIFTDSMFFNTMGDFVFSDFAGLMHWVGIRIPESIKLINNVLIILLLLFVSPFEKVNKLKTWMRNSMLLLALAGSYAVTFLIYVSFEAVHAHQLTGLNSRYFIPFIYLAIPALGILQLKSDRQYVNFLRVSKVLLALIGVVTLASLLNRFY